MWHMPHARWSPHASAGVRTCAAAPDAYRELIRTRNIQESAFNFVERGREGLCNLFDTCTCTRWLHKINIQYNRFYTGIAAACVCVCMCVCAEIHLSHLVDTCRPVTLALDDAAAENSRNLHMPFNFMSRILKTNRRHAAKHEIKHKKSTKNNFRINNVGHKPVTLSLFDIII